MTVGVFIGGTWHGSGTHKPCHATGQAGMAWFMRRKMRAMLGGWGNGVDVVGGGFALDIGADVWYNMYRLRGGNTMDEPRLEPDHECIWHSWTREDGFVGHVLVSECTICGRQIQTLD